MQRLSSRCNSAQDMECDARGRAESRKAESSNRPFGELLDVVNLAIFSYDRQQQTPNAV